MLGVATTRPWSLLVAEMNWKRASIACAPSGTSMWKA
jgi:hypothetical protein